MFLLNMYFITNFKNVVLALKKKVCLDLPLR